MRDILFRGFSKRADGKDKIVIGGKLIYGEWVFGFPFRDRRGKWKIRWHDEEYKSSKVSIVIPETVSQYIGITDKNGIKIFESDILVCKIYVGGNHIDYCTEIGYVEMKFGAFGLHRNTMLGPHHVDGYYRPFKDWMEDWEFEVIGNIFDGENELVAK